MDKKLVKALIEICKFAETELTNLLENNNADVLCDHFDDVVGNEKPKIKKSKIKKDDRLF